MPLSTTWGGQRISGAKHTHTYSHQLVAKIGNLPIFNFIFWSYSAATLFGLIRQECTHETETLSIPWPTHHLFRVRSKSNPVPTPPLLTNKPKSSAERNGWHERGGGHQEYLKFQSLSNQQPVSMTPRWLTTLFYCSSFSTLVLLGKTKASWCGWIWTVIPICKL